jgi:hypothetical protein
MNCKCGRVVEDNPVLVECQCGLVYRNTWPNTTVNVFRLVERLDELERRIEILESSEP